MVIVFFFQAEDGIRDVAVTGVQTCALPISFTNKAAGEMRTRIAQLLGADPRGLWIGTFHSLSARLLRREAPLLGFGPNLDRKSVVEGKSVDLGGRRVI